MTRESGTDFDVPKLLTETADLWVVEKPAGLNSVRLPSGGEASVVDWLLERYPTQIEVGDKPEDAGAIYRLDRETSGLLLFAKNSDALSFYRTLWKTDSVTKRYTALVGKSLTTPQTISYRIGRSEKGKGRSIAIMKEHDVNKIRGNTLRAISIVESCTKVSEAYRVLVRIETGVPHQIRCHLSALDAPILGDPLYGGTSAARMHLHCAEVEVPLRPGLPKIENEFFTAEGEGTFHFRSNSPF